MTTTEKLQRIKEICQANLEIAATRTPGVWNQSDNVVMCDATDGYYFITCDSRRTTMLRDKHNAAFIAACAGAAEAGWKATIAAIDSIRILRGAVQSHHGAQGDLDILTNDILFAWEDQL